VITRFAIFEGKVRQGREADMRRFVEERLAPLWREFAQAVKVEIQFGEVQDPNGPIIPLMLAITYKDEAGMQAGLDSGPRYESRDLLPEFYEEFFEEVRLFHYVMQTI